MRTNFIAGPSGPGDFFGISLSSGDFNGDGRDDFAIGVAFEDVNTKDSAGAVHVIYGTSGRLSATSPRPDQFWTRDTADITGTAHAFDTFGFALG